MTKHDLEKLIEIRGKDIYQFCYHLTGSREDADDLYQETLYKAFEKIQKIEDSEDSSFINERNYCLGIATRLYKNIIRKKYRRKEESLDDEQFDFNSNLSSDFCTEKKVEEKELYALLRKSIHELPIKQRQVVYLFYFADMSLKEISNCLRIPEGTVKSRLNTAKGSLKIKLEEKGYE